MESGLWNAFKSFSVRGEKAEIEGGDGRREPAYSRMDCATTMIAMQMEGVD